MKKWKKGLAMLLTAGILCTTGASAVFAGDLSGQTYISLGADLNDAEMAETLSLLRISGEKMAESMVSTVTNEEEYAYLGNFLGAEQIGDRALSSCVVQGKKEGHGITVETHNITYITPGMYENALVTAGVKDAQVVVAGPYEITGTAALVGVMKSYTVMTGEEISVENIEAATEELVTSGMLAEVIGDPEKVEQLIAAVKDAIISNNLTDPETIRQVIGEVSAELGITLTENQIQWIINLMQKIATLDLDATEISKQLSGIYDKIKNLDLSFLKSDSGNVLAKLGSFFTEMWSRISNWFNSMMGK